MSENKVIKAYAQIDGVYESNYGRIITTSSSATANGPNLEIAVQKASKIAKDIAYSKAQKEAELLNQIISFTLSENLESSEVKCKQEEEIKPINITTINKENKIIFESDNSAYTDKELNGIITTKNDSAQHISKNSILYVSSSISKKSGFVLVNSITTLENPFIYEFNVSWINSNENSQVEWTKDSKITFTGS